MDEQTARGLAAQLRKPEGEWAERVASFMSDGNALLIKRTIDTMAPADGDNILEIGMAGGTHIKDVLAKANGISYTGCDHSQEMVAHSFANNKGFIDERKVDFIHSNAMKMPFQDDTFDKIFTVNTVYFWDDVPAIAGELKRVLKPDGVLILGLRPESQMKKYPFTPYGFQLYTAEDAELMLAANGFTVTSIKQEDEPPKEVDGEMFSLSSLIITAHL